MRSAARHGSGTTAAAVFVVALAVYWSSLAPTVGAGDAGELIVAAWGLGVAHPPGYPLWCILGFLWSHCLPIGSVAYRLNLMSATLGAGAAAGLSALLVRRGARGWLAAVGGLVFATSGPIWSQAVGAEVYTVSAAMTVVFLLLFQRCVEVPSPQRVVAAAFAFGLGLAAHPSMVLLAPLWPALVLARWDDLGGRRLLKVAVAAQAAWVGPLVYAAYLPLAAASRPALNWGDPSTVQRWLAHVMRAQYGGYRWPGIGPSLAMVGHSLALLASALLWVGVPLAIIGAVGWWRGRLLGRLDLLALLCAGPAYALLLAGLLRGEQLEDVAGYYVGAVALAAILAAMGGEWLLRRSKASSMSWLCGIAAFVLVGGAVVVRSDRIGQAGNRVAHDYAVALLQSMPPGSDLYAQGDHELFPIMYVQTVEGYRQDVRLFDAAEGPTERDAYGYAQAEIAGRPILTTVPLGGLDRRTVPWGLALLVLPDSAPEQPARMPPPLRNQPPRAADRLGHLERDLLARYHLAQARYALFVGDLGSAVFEVERGAWLAADNPKELNNLATFCAREGLPELAERIWADALAVAPEYQVARRNLDLLRARPQSFVTLPD